MRTSTTHEYEQSIRQAVAMVLATLDQSISPGDVAQEVGFSRFHFGRIFSYATGESLASFRRRIRLERSAHQLEFTTISITEIAFGAGYETLEAFIKAFRSEYNLTPSDYRRDPVRHELQAACQVHWHPDGLRSEPMLRLMAGEIMQAQIKNIDTMSLLALRHVGPYHEIGPVFGRLAAWAGQSGVPIQGALVIYHDDPGATPPNELRSDACIVVPAGFELPENNLGVQTAQIPAGEYAVGTHMGSYQGLGDAWARLYGQAIPELGRATGPLCFEVYVNDCMQVPEEQLQTDLYVALS